MVMLYENDTEERVHLNVIKMLTARFGGVSADEIKRLYEILLKRFKKEAKVKDFLPILVSRRVASLFNKRREGKQDEKIYS